MARKYLQPPKKYMSRANAIRTLKLSEDDFATLAVLLNVMPVRAKLRQCLDHMDTIYYRIEDVQKMINTQLYIDINRKNRLSRMRKEYPGLGRYKKDVVVNYFALAMAKYPTFNSAVQGLPFSLKILYVKKWLCMQEKDTAQEPVDCDAKSMCSRDAVSACVRVLQSFCKVVARDFPLQKGFIGKDGFYLGCCVSACRVEWLVPFRLEEKKYSRVLDTLYPLCLAHVDLVATHLMKLANERSANSDVNTMQSRVLNGATFKIESDFYCDVYELVIASAGGRVSDSDYKYVLCDGEIRTLVVGVVYVHPQFVFDALNNGVLPDAQEYRVGCTPPQHKSPFREERNVADENDLFTMSRRDGEAYASTYKLHVL
eukprot:jgi/Antlo1/2202/1280